MDQKTFSIVAGLIFTLVALFHLVRIYMGWPVDIGDWSVPMWFSWIGLVVAGGLAFFGFRLSSSCARFFLISADWRSWPMSAIPLPCWI
jgi:hypothetical protein